MTTDEATSGIGLRTHLALGFGVISLVAVLVLLVVEGLGIGGALDGLDDDERQRLAEDVALDLAEIYAATGSWADADVHHAITTAEGSGAWLDVVSPSGDVITDTIAGEPDRGDTIGVPVVVDGALVGTARVSFTSAEAAAHRAHDYLWGWSLLAAGTALLVALAVGWVIAARLAGPLVELADTADIYAGGDHTARPAVRTNTREVARLATAVDSMSIAVEASERAQREMLEDVAHELRNPLAVLTGSLEEICDGLAEADPATLRSLRGEALRMGRVVEDLSSLAEARQPTAGGIHCLDLAEIDNTSVVARRGDFAAAGMHPEVDSAPTHVEGDPHRLSQVVGNLLDNCVRHCDRGDHVHVRIRPSGDHALLSVKDDGPGIDPDEIPRVFDRRYRGRSSRTPGSGIGLAVVQEIVRAHHGHVEVSAGADQGTHVIVLLPLCFPRPEPASSPPSVPAMSS